RLRKKKKARDDSLKIPWLMPPAEAGDIQLQQAHFRSPVDLLLSLVIRPPRCRYQPGKLGPITFRIGDKGHGRREDLVVQNARGQALQCSLFEAIPEPGVPTEETWPRERPCVIFLHGNSSCRLEALPLLPLLLPLRVSLFCFDFSGSGLSEGDYISLGWFEREDLAACVELLRRSGRVSRVALWGRSMGAFTAIMHADRDPSIAGLVLDSPFASLKDLATELAARKALMPSWATRAVLSAARSSIKARAGFDVEDLEALKHVGQSFMPALFIAAREDDFISPKHAERLFQAYQGEKEYYLTEGDHHSSRSVICRQKATLFLCRAFHCPKLDALLHLHLGGAVDIFSGVLPEWRKLHAGAHDLDFQGSEICRQLRVVPALSEMQLSCGRHCHRPMQLSAGLELAEKSEVGFFIKMVPVAGPGGTERDEMGEPCYLVLSCTSEMCMVSRVHCDSLRTSVVGPGLREAFRHSVSLSFSSGGRLRFLAEGAAEITAELPGFRGELTVWQMRLRGSCRWQDVCVEDSEATLREHLGDAVLRLRHLGHQDGVLLLNRDDFKPNRERPTGDHGLLDPAARPAKSTGSLCSDPDLQRVTLLECAHKPEVLIGWRVKIESVGEGKVLAVRKRRLRASLFSVGLPDNSVREIALKRAYVMLPWNHGYKFDLLRKEN
ncbi:unnamed protein product, partial [Effrenium voratum]